MACVRKYRGELVIDFRDAAGNRHIERVRSKSEGLEKLAEITKALRQGSFDPGRARTLFKDYAVTWLQSRRGEITQSTFTSYEYALRVHLISAFGEFEIGKITRAQVRFFLGRKAEQPKQNGQPLSKDTVRILKAVLHGIFETAVEDGILPSNPAHMKPKKGANAAARRAKGERQARIRAKVFNKEQLFLFLKTAKESASNYLAVFFLLARTGLRVGEALALRIGDLDFVNRLIYVERNLVKGVLGLTKSGLTRQVDMSAQLMRVLGQIVLDRKEQLMRLGMSVEELPSMWLFQNQAGHPMDDSKLRKVFARLLTKAGLAQRNLHFLRHTFASLLIQQGESLAYVKEQMGHSSIDITVDVYGHLVPGGNRQAVDRLDDDSEISDQIGMETKWKHFEPKMASEEKVALQVIEKTGATRRNRTGDLLITNRRMAITPTKKTQAFPMILAI
jgi:integrase